MQDESTINGRLVINGDGTVTDTETGLMWTASEIGKSSDGKICEGGENGFTWSEATELFGRGREMRPMANQVSGSIGTIEPDLIQSIYKNYKFSKYPHVFIGNYNDWRLPTVEEAWSLFTEENNQYEKKRIINLKTFRKANDIWTASYSGEHGARGEGTAWSTHHHTDQTVLLHFEDYCSNKHPVRLVRSGNVFNSTFDQNQRKESFLIKDDRFIFQGKDIPIKEIRDRKIKKTYKGKLLEVLDWTLTSIFLLLMLGILFGLFVFNSFWGYILIPIFIIWVISKVIAKLQDKYFYVLELTLSDRSKYEFTAEKEGLEIMEKTIDVNKLSK